MHHILQSIKVKKNFIMTDNIVNLLGLNAQVSSSSLAPKVKKSSASTGGGETSYTLTVTAETWRCVLKVHYS